MRAIFKHQMLLSHLVKASAVKQATFKNTFESHSVVFLADSNHFYGK